MDHICIWLISLRGLGVWIPVAAEVHASLKAELLSSLTHSPSTAKQQLRKYHRSPSGCHKQSERTVTCRSLTHVTLTLCSSHLPKAASHRKMDTLRDLALGQGPHPQRPDCLCSPGARMTQSTLTTSDLQRLPLRGREASGTLAQRACCPHFHSRGNPAERAAPLCLQASRPIPKPGISRAQSLQALVCMCMHVGREHFPLG